MAASTAPAGLSADPWLSSILGRPAWKIDANLPDVVSALSRARSGPGFFCTRVPTNDVATLKRLQDTGFRVIDTTVTLEAARRSVAAEAPKNARFAMPEDRAAVAAVAGSSFEWSRLHLDPPISNLANGQSDFLTNFTRICMGYADGIIGISARRDRRLSASTLSILHILASLLAYLRSQWNVSRRTTKDAANIICIAGSLRTLDIAYWRNIYFAVNRLMRANTNWGRFYRSMQRALPKQNANLELNLTDKEGEPL